jgi:hypothetical protein
LIILSGSVFGPFAAVSLVSKDGAVTTATSRIGAPRDLPTLPEANAYVCLALSSARVFGSFFEAAIS